MRTSWRRAEKPAHPEPSRRGGARATISQRRDLRNEAVLIENTEKKRVFLDVFSLRFGDVTGAEWAVIVHRCHTNNILPFQTRKMHRAISQLFCSLWA